MNEIIKSYQERFRRNRYVFRRYAALLLALAMITTLFVNWQLHGVGISMTADYQCGEIEHTHTAGCYTKMLVCGYNEGDLENPDQVVDFGSSDTSDSSQGSIALYGQDELVQEPQVEWVPHEHTDDCYTEVKTLTCMEEEHTHDDDCFDPEDGSLICNQFEHTHDDSCYTTELELTCGLQDGELVEQVVEPTESAALFEMAVAQPVAVEPVVDTVEPIYHHHTDDCYEEVLTCPFPEHHHTVNCLGDPYADIETEDEWLEKTDTTLDGLWSDDLIRVAKSQLGYEQSEKNFQLDGDDQVTVRHYTRYGQSYGNPYGEWDVMFLAYCLKYAQIPQAAVPQEASVLALRASMKGMDWLQDVDGSEAVPGDIVIYQKNADVTVAVQTGQDDDLYTENSVDTLDNDSAIALLPADSTAAVPVDVGDFEPATTTTVEQSTAPQTTTETRTVDTVGIVTDIDEDTGTLTVISGDVDGKVAEVKLAPSEVESVISVVSAQLVLDEDTGAQTMVGVNVADPLVDVTQYVTSITGEGTVYNEYDKTYRSDLTLNFGIPKDQITQNDFRYEIKLPAGIKVPDSLLNSSGQLLNGTTEEGNYTFIDKGDGTYSIVLLFKKDFIDNIDETTVSGHVTFRGTLGATGTIEDGKIKIPFFQDVDVVLNTNEHTFPNHRTQDYDLTVSKDGYYSIEDNKLVYTVYVQSEKGTPPDTNIVLKDVINVVDGSFKLGAPVSVTVTEQKPGQYGGYESTGTTLASDYQYDPDTGSLEVKLPALVKEENANTASRYKVEYIFDIPSDVSGSHKVSNTAGASAWDKKSKIDISGEAKKDIQVDRTYDIRKDDGQFDSASGMLTWKITVNSNKQNIAGWTLTDTMFDQAQDLTIAPSNGYEFVNDATNSKLTAIKFKELDGTTANNQTYTITYKTKATQSMTDQTVKNEFDYKPGDGSSGGTHGEATGTIPSSMGQIEKKLDSSTLQEDGTGALTWKTTLDVSKMATLPKDTVIYDDASPYSWQSEGRKHGLTKAQVQAWNGKFLLDSTEKSFNDSTAFTVELTGSDGETYDFSNVSTAPDGTTFQSFKITLLKDLDLSAYNTMSWSYSTSLTEGLIRGNNLFRNEVKINEKSASAEYTFYKSGILKMDGSSKAGTTDVTSADGVLKWQVKILAGNETYDKITFKDTLPEGVTISDLKVTEYGGTWDTLMSLTTVSEGSLSSTSNHYGTTGTYQNGVLQLELKRTDGDQKISAGSVFYVTYSCKIPDADLNDGKTHTYANTAEIWFNDNYSNPISSKQTQNWTKTTTTVDDYVIKKDVLRTSDTTQNRLAYTVSINPDGKQLLQNATEPLTLEDKLSMPRHPGQLVLKKPGKQDYEYISPDWVRNDCLLEASLDPTSVKLYKAVKDADGNLTKGDEVTGWKWTYSKDETSSPDNYVFHTILVSGIPDSTPLIFEYAYTISDNVRSVIEQQPDYQKAELKAMNLYNEIQNHASLQGTSYQTDKNADKSDWNEVSSSGGVSGTKSYVYTLYKADADNFGKRLSGAEFKLQKYLDGNWADEGKTYTTDPNGRIKISKDSYTFQNNTLYRLVETKAPSGYKLPDDVEAPEQTIRFYYSADGDSYLPNGGTLMSGAVDLSTMNAEKYISNVQDDSPGYELPSTGGTGTLPFTAVGGTMMLAALVYGVRRKRRHEGRAD